MLPYFVFDTISIGPFTLYVWGLFAGLAFAAALVVVLKEAKRKNIAESHILNLAVLVLVGVILGSRLAFVFENWDYFSRNPGQIFLIQTGGLMFYGGAVLSFFLATFYILRKKLSFWRIADAGAPSLAIGEFIGRIGCSLADLHIGTITALSWGQKYIDGTIRHPIGIYMSINGLALFIFLWLLRKKTKIEGALFLIFILWYSGTRFLLDFLRCNDLSLCDPRYFGLTLSQYISVPLFFLSIIILTLKYKNMEEQQGRVFKKYWVWTIVLIISLTIGFAVSSAYYERLFKLPIFSFRAKTWVSYDEPIIKLIILNDKNCLRCNTSEIIKQLKTAIPTLSAAETDFRSAEGEKLIKEFSVKSLPSFVFDSKIEKAAIFEKIKAALRKEDGQYYVNPLMSGVTPGKFLELPQLNKSDRFKGSDSAPITLIEFSDFQCPFCKKAQATVKQILADYPDKVKLAYKHLPLAIHPDAEYAAEAAECAGDQGKFWEMSETLFTNQEKLDKNSINKYGRELKLDYKKFSDCLFVGKFKAKIDADAKTAAEFGITSTPAFFVGDEFISGDASFEDFKTVIENQLKNK